MISDILSKDAQKESQKSLFRSPQQKPLLAQSRSRFPNVKMEQAAKKDLFSGDDVNEDHCNGLESSSLGNKDLLDDTLNISEDDSLDIVVVPREVGRTEDHNQPPHLITILDDSADEQVRELERIFSQATIV